MNSKPIKIPGPDHPITVAPNPLRVLVSVAGRVIADTREALTLREATPLKPPSPPPRSQRRRPAPQDSDAGSAVRRC
jgi:hypothetical protein